MKLTRNLLLALSIIALLTAAYYRTSAAQSTATYAIRWEMSGATQQEANQNLIRFLASAIQGSGSDADIYQRDVDGTVLLDAQGRKRIAPAKVNDVFRALIQNQVNRWAEGGDIGELTDVQVQSITNQVKAQPRPAVTNPQ